MSHHLALQPEKEEGIPDILSILPSHLFLSPLFYLYLFLPFLLLFHVFFSFFLLVCLNRYILPVSPLAIGKILSILLLMLVAHHLNKKQQKGTKELKRVWFVKPKTKWTFLFTPSFLHVYLLSFWAWSIF